MLDLSKVRRIRYSAYCDIPDPDMTKAWCSWKRKKTLDGDTLKLLKIDGQRAVNQYAVNLIKHCFGMRPLKVEVVFDEESQQLGQFVDWIPALCNIGKMTGWLKDTGNMQEIIRILLFDAAVGNNDRMTCNVLVGTDYRIFGIDEADCFRFKSPIKVKFRKEIRFPIIAYAQNQKKWLTDLSGGVRRLKNAAYTSLLGCGVAPDLAKVVLHRMDRIKVVSDILFCGENADALLR